jgi:hypothetical protein
MIAVLGLAVAVSTSDVYWSATNPCMGMNYTTCAPLSNSGVCSWQQGLSLCYPGYCGDADTPQGRQLYGQESTSYTGSPDPTFTQGLADVYVYSFNGMTCDDYTQNTAMCGQEYWENAPQSQTSIKVVWPLHWPAFYGPTSFYVGTTIDTHAVYPGMWYGMVYCCVCGGGMDSRSTGAPTAPTPGPSHTPTSRAPTAAADVAAPVTYAPTTIAPVSVHHDAILYHSTAATSVTTNGDGPVATGGIVGIAVGSVVAGALMVVVAQHVHARYKGGDWSFEG